MKMFEDSKGRTWELNLSLAAARRIEACDFSDLTEKKISILNMHANDCLQEVIGDPSIMFACIWCCVKPQADKLEVTQEEFAEGVTGAVIVNGREAWVEELADFFPEMATALSKMLAVQKKGVAKAKKKIDKVADHMTERAEKELDKALAKAERETLG